MLVIETIADMKRYSAASRAAGCSLAFVPTMGYLHEGHLSLVRLARERANRVIVSIFVNPLQFNDPADLEKYPRDTPRDLALLEAEKVDVVFLPNSQEVYPDGPPGLRLTHPLMQELCGKTRPGHFEGMLHIVHNLLLWTNPHYAVFGRKDYQQLKLIEIMNRELSLGVTIVSAPIIREPDGLAMSSRNARLSAAGRSQAAVIPRTLAEAARLAGQPGISVAEVNLLLSQRLAAFKTDYAAVFDPQTLKPLSDNQSPRNGLLAVAVYIEGVRLIDNRYINEE